jgi:hypothetical protein
VLAVHVVGEPEHSPPRMWNGHAPVIRICPSSSPLALPRPPEIEEHEDMITVELAVLVHFDAEALPGALGDACALRRKLRPWSLSIRRTPREATPGKNERRPELQAAPVVGESCPLVLVDPHATKGDGRG